MIDRPTEMSQKIELGAHRLRWSPPDLLDLVIRGVFGPKEAAEFLRVVFETGDKYGKFFLRCDVRAMTEVPPQSRALLSRLDRPYPYRGIALVGASFPMRILIDTILRAGRTLGPRYFGFPATFHEDWESAGAWISKERGEHSHPM